jgi:hypothetical protein
MKKTQFAAPELTSNPREFWRDVAMCDCKIAEHSGKAMFYRFHQAEPDAGAMSRDVARYSANPYFNPDNEAQLDAIEPTSMPEWAWDLGWRLGAFLALGITSTGSAR